ENARLAGARVNPLNIAALVILGRTCREKPALGIFIATIVAKIEPTVGAARQSVRTTTPRPDRRFAAVQRDARHAAPFDLAQNHRAVGHRDWTFRKLQTPRDYPYVHHHGLSPLSDS